MANAKVLTAVGKDIIYVCTHCHNREKEFAFSDRQYKYCFKCGAMSIKSTLMDSYNYMSSTFHDPTINQGPDIEYEYE